MIGQAGSADAIVGLRPAAGRPFARRGPRAAVLAVSCLTTAALTGGCGYSGGKLLYFLGLMPKQKVKAKFHLTKGRLLILVDDPKGRVAFPAARDALVSRLIAQLAAHRVNRNAVPPAELTRLRQNEPDFAKLQIRVIGERLGAEQVLYLYVQDFSLHAEGERVEGLYAGQFAVRVKVINVKAQNREELRLWPQDPDGELVEVTEGRHTGESGHAEVLARKLAAMLADAVAKNFYDYEVDPTEPE